jgi:predicted  nucleic acid-binding Zn-ribbon protein
MTDHTPPSATGSPEGWRPPEPRGGSDHRALIEEAKEKDLERRFGSWQDLDLNADGTEADPIENIATDAFALIARLAEALEQTQVQASEIADYAAELIQQRERLSTALAEVRDHLQQASDEIRELSADRDATLARAERLAGYVRHKKGCSAAPYEPYPGYPCTCGLSAALGLAGDEQ